MNFRKSWPALLLSALLLLSACGPAEDRALLPIGAVLNMDVSVAFLFSDLEGTLYQVSKEGGGPVFVLEKAASFGSGGDSRWAITEDGALYTWGGNKYGELGNGAVEESDAPQKILDGVAKAGMEGSGHAWALLESGSLYVWGTVYQRMFGEQLSLSPQKILDDVVFYEFPLAITDDGGLYIWGGDLTAPTVELQDGAFLPAPKRIADHVEEFYRAGPFLYVLQKDGSLHTWTNLNAYPYAKGPAPVMNALESHMVLVLNGVKHVELLASGAGLALLENGDVYTWGISDENDCAPGFGTQGEARLLAKKFSGAKEAYAPGYALTGAGDLYGWGIALGDRFCGDAPKNNGEPALLLSDVRAFYPGDHGAFAAITKDGALVVRDVAAGEAADLPEPVRLLERVAFASYEYDGGRGLAMGENGTLYRLDKANGVTKAEAVLENVTAVEGLPWRFLAVSGKYLMLADVTYHEENGKVVRLEEAPRKIAVLPGR